MKPQKISRRNGNEGTRSKKRSEKENKIFFLKINEFFIQFYPDTENTK